MSAVRPATAPRKKKLLVTLGGGGHLYQAKSLIRSLGDAYEFCYVTTPDSMSFSRSGLPEGRIFRIPSIISFTEPPWRLAWNRVASVFVAFYILATARPDAVICVATAFSIPLLLAARLTGRRGIYIESITRVRTRTVTGRIVDRLRLARRFYAQWPVTADLYRSAVYRGTVV